MDFVVKWVLFQPVHKLPSALRWEKGGVGAEEVYEEGKAAEKSPSHPSRVVID